MKYLPRVLSSNRIAGPPLGGTHTVALFDNIESEGAVQYVYLLGVFENATHQPVFFVASDVNTTVAKRGGGSHCLGTFDDRGYSKLGSSDDWGDPKKFFPKALQIAEARFAPSRRKA